jgi:hypothetical protein
MSVLMPTMLEDCIFVTVMYVGLSIWMLIS